MIDVGFGTAEYSDSMFDETFNKAGIYAGNSLATCPVYAGGVTKSDYERGNEQLETMNKAWATEIRKAQLTTSQDFVTSTNYSSTSGSIPALIPLGFTKEIINLSRKKTPVYEILPKMAVRGKYFTWNKATFATTNAAFKFEDAAMAEYDDSYAPSVLQMKYAYAVGRVSGPMQIASQEYINAEQNEIMMKSRALLQLIENKIVNGSASTYAQEFSGLTTLLTTNQTSLGAALAISNLRDHILYCEQGGESYSAVYGGGSPDLIITNRQTVNDIKALLQAYLRYNDISTTLAWGMRAVEFEGIPIIASAFMTTTSTSKELYIIDTDVVRLAVSLPMTMERLAKTDDSNKFMIKWYGALWVGNDRWCAKIDTIT